MGLKAADTTPVDADLEILSPETYLEYQKEKLRAKITPYVPYAVISIGIIALVSLYFGLLELDTRHHWIKQVELYFNGRNIFKTLLLMILFVIMLCMLKIAF